MINLFSFLFSTQSTSSDKVISFSRWLWNFRWGIPHNSSDIFLHEDITLSHTVSQSLKHQPNSCVNCPYNLYGLNNTPTHRVGAILQSPCPSVGPSVHTFVTNISASNGRNDFIFDIWLWHGDLYRVSPFQVYRTSTSCLQCDLEFFMFAVMKTFVTVISASTGRNDFIFDICLPCDLQMNQWGYS